MKVIFKWILDMYIKKMIGWGNHYSGRKGKGLNMEKYFNKELTKGDCNYSQGTEDKQER